MLKAAQQPQPGIGLDLVHTVRRWRRDLSRDRAASRVALLGDSVLGGSVGERTVPDATSEALARCGRRGQSIAVHPLSWPGWGVSGEYFLNDEIVRARPDVILLELNLRGMGPATPGAASYPELAGFVRPERLLEAASLPLSYAGLTLDRLLFYHLLVASGADEAWATVLRRQASLFRLREPIEAWFDAALGNRAYVDRRVAVTLGTFDKVFVPGKNRERLELVQTVLGNALGGLSPTHPRLRILGAMLEHYRRAGIPTIVWVAPVNVDHLRSLGLPLEGLRRSLGTIRTLVEANGAALIDLHDLLRDEAFIDAGDHVTSNVGMSGATMLGESLARVLLSMAPRERRPRPADTSLRASSR